MRSLTVIWQVWRDLLELGPADCYLGRGPEDDEVFEGKRLFRVIRAEEADGLNQDAMAWHREMLPREQGFFPLLVRLVRQYLDALGDIMSEELPSDEYADVNLAHKLVNAITDPLTRWAVLSGFVIGLAKEHQAERARATLFSLEFPSPLMRFETVLGIYRITKDPSDLLVAQGSADRLSTHPRLKRKRYAKVRAYLAIYNETHAPLDLFVARNAAREEGIDPEEAALANIEIFSTTHNSDDLGKARQYLARVMDAGRRAALQYIVDQLE
jgi:hypothetical protein